MILNNGSGRRSSSEKAVIDRLDHVGLIRSHEGDHVNIISFNHQRAFIHSFIHHLSSTPLLIAVFLEPGPEYPDSSAVYLPVSSLPDHGLHLLNPLLSGMMARKRKANPHARNIQHTLKRKRQKNSYTVLSSSETEESTDQNSDIGEDEWLIRCILDEDETQYLIDWEGSWSPTWVSWNI